MKIRACGVTHKGNIRNHNEDNIYIDGQLRRNVSDSNVIIKSERDNELHTFAVFDGLGGEVCGEQASLIAALGLGMRDRENRAPEIKTYISALHRTILEEIKTRDIHGMGTTAAILRIEDNKASVFNIGDSRVYLFRDGSLRRLTKDHTVVQSLIDLGIIGESERNSNKHAGELTQYIGMTSDNGRYIEPGAFYTEEEIREEDIFLLCSDGLTGELTEEEIKKIIDEGRTSGAENVSVNLVKGALEKTGRDNVSVISVFAES